MARILVHIPPEAVPRTADPFVPGAAARLSPERVQKYDLVTATEIERMVASHRTRLVVFGEQKWVFGGLEREPRWRLSVTRARYRRIASLDFADVYLTSARASTGSGWPWTR